ncbi:MAG TPA: nitroreductase family protein [Acidimicrobiales bacterium]
MNGRPAVDVLHRSTMHGEPPAAGDRLLAFRPLDPANRPAPFKTYAGAETVPLPRELRRSSSPAVDVLSGHHPDRGRLDDDLLGTLLFLAAGVTRVAHTVDGAPVWFRSAMSAGNLHPVEVYVIGEDVHHYHPLDHALVRLRRGVHVSDEPALVLTGIPFRTCWKYGERGWRHLWWDAGALLANLLAAAGAHGVPARIMAGFPDAAVAALVGVDGVDEVPLAVVGFGDGDLRLPDPDALEPLTAQAGPVAPRVLRFPLVTEAHAETTLDRDAVAGWRRAALGASRPAPATVEPPPEVDPDDRVERVILRRGSTRLFHRRQAPAPLLQWGLPAAARAVPLDAAPAGTLLEHLASVHDVADAEAGAYRYRAGTAFEGRTRSDDPRRVAAHLCLDQPLGGDAAYTVFHAAALDPLLDTLGGRGYRAAQLEAGIAAGRLALAAVALGAGATGLTFYDGAVSRYFRTESAPLLATAVGIPATRPAPSGSPGRPSALPGYGRVMARLAARLDRP